MDARHRTVTIAAISVVAVVAALVGVDSLMLTLLALTFKLPLPTHFGFTTGHGGSIHVND